MTEFVSDSPEPDKPAPAPARTMDTGVPPADSMFELSTSEHPTVTADDIRVLAKSNSADPVLVLAGGRLVVMDAAQVEAAAGRVVYTKRRLVADAGTDVTDIEAELLAGRIAAALAGVPITSVPATGVPLPDVR